MFQNTLKEFREFALKGNMIDLAVGVIIGAAFSSIVSSIVDDIFMPIIGLIIGGVDFSNLYVVLSNPQNLPANSLAVAKQNGVATLNVGLFLNALVKFTIIAFVLFMVVKALNSLKKKEVATPEAPAAISAEEALLTEIRDLLKAQAAPEPALAAPATPVPPAETPAPRRPRTPKNPTE